MTCSTSLLAGACVADSRPRWREQSRPSALDGPAARSRTVLALVQVRDGDVRPAHEQDRRRAARSLVAAGSRSTLSFDNPLPEARRVVGAWGRLGRAGLLPCV